MRDGTFSLVNTLNRCETLSYLHICTSRSTFPLNYIKNDFVIAGNVNKSSLVFEEALGGAALLDGDRQEVGRHVRHQDLVQVARTRPPGRFVRVVEEPGRRRPVQEVRLLRVRGSARARFGAVLEVRRRHVAALGPVRVRCIRLQAAVGVKLLVGRLPALRVVMMMMMVKMVSVGRLFTSVEFGEFVRAVAELLLRSPLVRLGDGGAAAAVRRSGLRPPLPGPV